MRKTWVMNRCRTKTKRLMLTHANAPGPAPCEGVRGRSISLPEVPPRAMSRSGASGPPAATMPSIASRRFSSSPSVRNGRSAGTPRGRSSAPSRPPASRVYSCGGGEICRTHGLLFPGFGRLGVGRGRAAAVHGRWKPSAHLTGEALYVLEVVLHKRINDLDASINTNTQLDHYSLLSGCGNCARCFSRSTVLLSTSSWQRRKTLLSPG